MRICLDDAMERATLNGRIEAPAAPAWPPTPGLTGYQDGAMTTALSACFAGGGDADVCRPSLDAMAMLLASKVGIDPLPPEAVSSGRRRWTASAVAKTRAFSWTPSRRKIEGSGCSTPAAASSAAWRSAAFQIRRRHSPRHHRQRHHVRVVDRGEILVAASAGIAATTRGAGVGALDRRGNRSVTHPANVGMLLLMRCVSPLRYALATAVGCLRTPW